MGVGKPNGCIFLGERNCCEANFGDLRVLVDVFSDFEQAFHLCTVSSDHSQTIQGGGASTENGQFRDWHWFAADEMGTTAKGGRVEMVSVWLPVTSSMHRWHLAKVGVSSSSCCCCWRFRTPNSCLQRTGIDCTLSFHHLDWLDAFQRGYERFPRRGQSRGVDRERHIISRCPGAFNWMRIKLGTGPTGTGMYLPPVPVLCVSLWHYLQLYCHDCIGTRVHLYSYQEYPATGMSLRTGSPVLRTIWNLYAYW